MKKKHLVFSVLAAVVVALVVCQTAWADRDKPVARVLDPVDGYDEFTFQSSGGQILFAEIRSDVFQTTGRNGGGHEPGGGDEGGCSDSESTVATGMTCTDGGSDGGSEGGGSDGGCSDGGTDGGCSDGDEGGCGGGTGGHADLCLQVLDPYGQKLCWAGRPQRPGWKRDPRLACPIPEDYEEPNNTFTLRVFRGQCGNPDMNAVSPGGDTPTIYLLEFQLMDMAEEGGIRSAMSPGYGN